jgi:hypothetical protein
MTKEEFEGWVKGLTKPEGDLATGFFSVIRREPAAAKQLRIVPYRSEYGSLLAKAAELLRAAAKDTTNPSLQRFLESRATAFLTDDYFDSDVAWMDLDAPLEVTIGPYETYDDELFGYKASFEAYICLRDDLETEKLKDFSKRLQEVEDHLPIEARFRNPKLGSTTPIRVVNEVFGAGDGNYGVQTAAYNLPNDERVVQQKGSKKILLKNVQHAKFDTILTPISKTVLSAAAQEDCSFDAFFTHTLAHELSHGIGPHEIKVEGRATSVRLELKDLYSTIEEAKADVTGLLMLQYFFDKGYLPGGEANERRLYNTYLASTFRTLRFGITEAHGRGMALQFNYLVDQGAFHERQDGGFDVDFAKITGAVTSLASILLNLEARGDYQGAATLLGQYANLRPNTKRLLARLNDLPVDIEPVFTTADELSREVW